MFCTICGKKNEDGLEFCGGCSAQLYQPPERLHQQLQPQLQIQPQTKQPQPQHAEPPQPENLLQQIDEPPPDECDSITDFTQPPAYEYNPPEQVSKQSTGKSNAGKAAAIIAAIFCGIAIIVICITVLPGILFDGVDRPEGTYIGRIDDHSITYIFDRNNFEATLSYAGQSLTLNGRFRMNGERIFFDIDSDHVHEVMLGMWQTDNIIDESINNVMFGIAESNARWFYENGNTHIEIGDVRISRS